MSARPADVLPPGQIATAAGAAANAAAYGPLVAAEFALERSEGEPNAVRRTNFCVMLRRLRSQQNAEFVETTTRVIRR